MVSYIRGLRTSKMSFLLAVLVIGAAPAASQAGWLGFRNDLKGAVIIQAGTPVGKALVRWGRAKELQVGEVAWDVVLQPGIRQIKILDGTTKQLLLLQNIPVKGDLFISIQLDPVAGVKLVPIKAPMAPPGRQR